MKLTSDRIALGLCIYLILVQLLYASATPPFEAPDASSHFRYVHELVEQRQFPIIVDTGDLQATNSMERHQPPLYYTLGAALIFWTDRSDYADYTIRNPQAAIGSVAVSNNNVYLDSPSQQQFGKTLTAIWIMRLLSIGLSAITLWYVYRSGQIAFPERPIGLPAMLLVASIPTFVFIGASINNDNLVTCLYAIGVYLCLRLWRERQIRNADIVVMGVVLAAASLSKLTGLGLVGIVILSVLIGGWRGHYSWKDGGKLIAGVLLICLILAGWWYARNQILYGDPMALRATLELYGRGPLPDTLGAILGELRGVWISFWMLLGWFSIAGPAWVYTYATLLTMTAAAGLVIGFRKLPLDRVVFLLAVFGIVLTLFVQATMQINVSQGRILFPALVAIAPLMVAGLESFVGRVISRLLLLPLVFLTLWTGAVLLPRSYPELERVTALPEGVTPVDAQSDTLSFLGYRFQPVVVQAGDVVTIDVYFHGQDPNNPVLAANLVDPITRSVLGGTLLYPGSTRTSELDPNNLYETPVTVALSEDGARLCSPCRLDLILDWRDLESGEPISLVAGDGHRFDQLVVPGPVIAPPALSLEPERASNVVFGEAIRLMGIDGTDSTLTTGDVLAVTLYWVSDGEIDQDYVMAFGLLNAEGQLVVQGDGPVPGYPTSAWIAGMPFADPRTLEISDELPPGTYQLYVGWYDLSSGDRIAAVGDSVKENLYFFPEAIVVEAGR